MSLSEANQPAGQQDLSFLRRCVMMEERIKDTQIVKRASKKRKHVVLVAPSETADKVCLS
jgi:hypothetical protein